MISAARVTHAFPVTGYPIANDQDASTQNPWTTPWSAAMWSSMFGYRSWPRGVVYVERHAQCGGRWPLPIEATPSPTGTARCGEEGFLTNSGVVVGCERVRVA